jgi:hypothetical protein
MDRAGANHEVSGTFAGGRRLRHAFGSLYALQQMLGPSSADRVKRYLPIAQADVEDAHRDGWIGQKNRERRLAHVADQRAVPTLRSFEFGTDVAPEILIGNLIGPHLDDFSFVLPSCLWLEVGTANLDDAAALQVRDFAPRFGYPRSQMFSDCPNPKARIHTDDRYGSPQE